LTVVSSAVPSTLVVATLSGSLRRHEKGDGLLGWLTTTRVGFLDPVTVVDRLDESESAVPPSTTCVGTSHTDPYCTVFGAGAHGEHGGFP
jgi:hypothetical protein